MNMLHSFLLFCDLFFFPENIFILFFAHQSYLISLFPQPQICVILAEEKPVFCPAGHHPVRLMVFLGHQVVNEHPDIRFRPVQDQHFFSQYLHGRVNPCHQSLGSRLFVSRASIKLPSGKQTFDLLKFQGRVKLVRINAVILYGVGVSHDPGVFQSGHRPVHFVLDIFRQGTGHASDVHFIGIQAFRFNKHLMPVLICKFYHLILYGRTVSGSCSFYHTRKKRRTV